MKKYVLKDIVIAILILIIPFLFYLYKIIPEDVEIWETSYFTLGHGGFFNVHYFFWNISVKLFLILILAIWFYTSKHWWRYAILIPFFIEIMKLINLLRVDVIALDELDFLYSLPFTIPVVIFLIYLSKKMGYYSVSIDIENELNQEINSIFFELSKNKENELTKLELELFELRKNNESLDKKTYLKKLLKIQEKSLNL